jgi:hypothetical protein
MQITITIDSMPAPHSRNQHEVGGKRPTVPKEIETATKASYYTAAMPKWLT